MHSTVPALGIQVRDVGSVATHVLLMLLLDFLAFSSL